ncbi:ChrR family anti-sigma-E factor [Porticoccaceae bacterium nBUS_17]
MSSIKHHPSRAMLVDFSAGNLGTAESICVSAHLHFCDQCRNELMRLDQVASQLMTEAEPQTIDEDLFDSVMSKIDALPEAPMKVEIEEKSDFPHTVAKLINETESAPNWRRMSSSVDVARFQTGQNKFEVALHRICAGGKTPHHGHNGTEFTVVLKGSFSDEQAVYSEGDFLLRGPGDEHQPMGAQNGECICLSALAAPIKLSSPLGFLMKPWLRINPM